MLVNAAIIAYKSVPTPRNSQKLVHLILHLLALISGILGIYAVFKFKNKPDQKDMVTLHSWLGIITISLFGLQVYNHNTYLEKLKVQISSYLFITFDTNKSYVNFVGFCSIFLDSSPISSQEQKCQREETYYRGMYLEE